MIRKTLIDELVRGITESVVRLGSVKDDVEKQVRATITATLDKLDIVTRDEYEVQQLLSSRLRERLEKLEQRVSVLESQAVTSDIAASPTVVTAPTSNSAESGNTGRKAGQQWANDEPAVE